jgi:hypothetical protein
VRIGAARHALAAGRAAGNASSPPPHAEENPRSADRNGKRGDLVFPADAERLRRKVQQTLDADRNGNAQRMTKALGATLENETIAGVRCLVVTPKTVIYRRGVTLSQYPRQGSNL